MRVQPEVAAGFCRPSQLLYGPGLAGLHVAGQFGWSKACEKYVKGRMTCDQLSLQMRRQFRDGKPGVGGDAQDFITITLAFARKLQIEETAVPGWYLDAGKAQSGSPVSHASERIEWRSIARKLRKKNPRSFNGLHNFSPRKLRSYLKLNPAFFAVTLNDAVNKPHAADTGDNARQRWRQRVGIALLPGHESISKLAVENRECFQRSEEHTSELQSLRHLVC